MQKLLLRYRVFLSLLLVLLGLSWFSPELGQTALIKIKGNFQEMLGVIPPVFILLGLLDVWVDRQTMIKYTGSGSGLRGLCIAFFLGSAAAGPLYAAFPVAGMMLKKGSSLWNVFIFMGAWSTTKIPMLTFEGSALGVKFMACRLALSIIGIIAIAWLLNQFLSTEEKAAIYQLHDDSWK